MLTWQELRAFLRAYRLARRKRHGRGKAPIGEAVFLARCSAYIAGRCQHRWLYPHWRWRPEGQYPTPDPG